MNIIKLKDIIMPDNMLYAEYFNKYLKGKYAYWVQMRYIVPFDFMRHEGYVACEEDITKLLQKPDGTYPKPYGAPCLDVYEECIIPFIDQLETDRINNIIEYRLKNKYTPDEDITIDELKKFRTWLSTEILSLDQNNIGLQMYLNLNSQETHMLKYYSNNMYDDTIKILNDFGQDTININTTGVTKSCNCGCNSNSFSSISNLYSSNINLCNPIELYTKNIYKYMVNTFSDVKFWERWPQTFIFSFKKYIDNIINIGLPFNIENTTSFNGCECLNQTDKQRESIDILKRLSVSLEYIAYGRSDSHKNYIFDALNDWASLLYEKMEW